MSGTEDTVMVARYDSRYRCDKCGAQAYHRAELATGPLYFCGHHFRIMKAGLIGAGASFDDEPKLDMTFQAEFEGEVHGGLTNL